MNCEQCLGTGPFLCGPLHAARALAAGVGRLWRGMLASLAALG
jgi:hypothetical protein